MTIQFYCPSCDALIAFDSKHAGKRARCTTCGQVFIIPSKDNEKPEKIKLEIEKGEPLPGFYRAAFVDSWKLFIDTENVTSLAFVIAAVCFKFFSAGSCCCAYIIHFTVWGWLFGFYLNIIYETAFEIEQLPQIHFATSTTLGEAAYLWYIIKPFLIFFATMAVVQIPFIIALVLLADKGVTYENMWEAHTGPHLLLQALFISGLFLFPMAILTVAVGKQLAMLRPDYILTPIFKAFIPYLVVVALLVAAGAIEMQTVQYDHSALGITAGRLALNLAVQLIAIIAMRSIGLFYRHYSCHLPW